MKLRVNKVLKEYVLRVVVDVVPQYEYSVAASTAYIQDRSIKRKLKLTKQQIEELNELVDKTLMLISSFDFKLIANYQSKRSFSYYIKFVPTDRNGDEWEYPSRIQFEIRDHISNSHMENGDASIGVKTFVFHVGGRTSFNTRGVLDSIKDTCYRLQNGDYSSLEIAND